jgi:AcrR family transcriptional regulator
MNIIVAHMSRRGTRATRGYHHGDLEAALIAATLVRIERDGLTGWSLRELARDVGVSPAAPYNHFEDRTALIAAVAEAGFRELVATQTAALSRARHDPRARLRALGAAYVEFARRDRAYFLAMFHADSGSWTRFPGLREAAHVAFLLLHATVREAGHSERDALVVWSLVHGAATLWIDGPLRDHAPEGPERFVEAAIDRILADGPQSPVSRA